MPAHDFSWTKVYDIDIDTAEHYRLIKGVAMSEGEMKRGEIMNEDNLRYATGALAASAVLGFAVCDIDHWPEGLPSQKELTDMGAEGYNYSKYNIEKINDVYPCCYIIDAELVQNKAGVDGAPKWQVEFIAACENEEVYQMIKANKFKGNSVVDFPREYSCDKCNAETGKCTCDVKGSKFMLNTLILEAIPNSNATWVAAVNKNDIGGILKPHSNSTKNADWLENRINLFKKNILDSTDAKQNTKVKNEFEPSDVDSYQTDGKWTDGAESIQAFLENEKGIASEEAASIAKFIFENPSLLNKEQLEALSGDDIVEWFRHLQTIDRKHLHKFIHEIKNALLEFSSKVTHSTLLTQEAAAYREAEDENACASCRWSNFSDDPVTDESEGTCQLVEGTITAPAVCDRHEPIPGEEPEEEEGEDDGEETGGDETEGEEESKNDSETETESIETPTEDGVTDDAKEDEDLDALETAANTAPQKHSKPKRTVSLNPSKHTANLNTTDARIKALEKERTDLGFIVGNSRDSMKRQSRYDSLTRQIKNLKLDKTKIPKNGMAEIDKQLKDLMAQHSTPEIKAEITRLENLKKK